ncbi:tetratricopeptide repeat protein [Sediminibacterium ginsengisoli]|uniref:Oxygen sensor histidine kinase NreB n=1 Tax=Sediminibacterium ginsengisoli TaxID=413434 RepID=A0A1T4L036_9BACT|nr:tetratricopeptide repeat protein [Sediminibacterium ginsengisoli]SJZ47971.1 Signal transduction histidine kinase [Sediminibacterium ginsengisoli]
MRNRTGSFLLLLFLCCVNDLTAQTVINADSLRQALPLARHDTVRLRILQQLSVYYYRGARNLDSAVAYTNRYITGAKGFPALARPVAEAYNRLGIIRYQQGEYEKSLEAFRNQYRHALQYKDSLNMSNGINNQGNVYIEKRDYTEALKYYNEALQIRRAIRDNNAVAQSLANIGFIHKDLGNYEKATDYFLQALRVFEQMNDEPRTADVYNYLGTVAIMTKRFDKAIDYSKQALRIQDKLSLPNKGISLISLGTAYAEKQDFETALAYLLRARTHYTPLNDKRQLLHITTNLAEVYFRKKEFGLAEKHYLEALQLAGNIGNRRSVSTYYLGLAQAYIEQQKFTAARTAIDSAAVSSLKSGNNAEKKQYYEIESKYYEAIGNLKQALEQYRLFVEAKDSLLNTENSKAIADLNIRYETEKKELKILLLGKADSIKSLQISNQQLELTRSRLVLADAQLAIANNELEIKSQEQQILRQQLDSTQKEKSIQSLKELSRIQLLELDNQKLLVAKRNIWIGIIALMFLSALLLGYSFYSRYKRRQEARLQATILQQQELASKAVIEAEEKERSRIATDLHDGVGQVMSAAKMNLSAMEGDLAFADPSHRAAFEKVVAMIDESCKEVRAVSHNMMPNALLKSGLASAVREFINQIDDRIIQINLYTEGLQNKLDSNTETVLYRVIQECVNNVIKHARANHLDISLFRDEDGLSATIEDNGVGFDPQVQRGNEGIGMKNIQTRISYLKGTVEWNSSPGQGTVIAIHVPLANSL